MHDQRPATNDLPSAVAKLMVKAGRANAKQLETQAAGSTAPFKIDAVDEKSCIQWANSAVRIVTRKPGKTARTDQEVGGERRSPRIAALMLI